MRVNPSVPDPFLTKIMMVISELGTTIKQTEAIHAESKQHLESIKEIRAEHQKNLNDYARFSREMKQAVTMIPVQKGDKGDSPSKHEIASIVEPMIPSDEKIRSLIAPLIATLLPVYKETPTPEQIVQLTMKELKKKPITIDDVHGLPNTIREIKNRPSGFMHGGGDTVVAGTGVTITQTNGIKTISASVGGITTLAATETPNGTNTIFTFATATSQPSFLLVDNVWQRATTKSGTVNWTWAAGPKQATLTIPPADEILAVV